MTKLDMHWLTNPDWYIMVKTEDGFYDDIIRDDAPPEAQESYKRYLSQLERIAEDQRRLGGSVHII